MAYQIFSQGNDKNWDKLHYDIEYETTRNGTDVGIRCKIKWSIKKGYFFGYNINAQVWIKGNDYGRIIKKNEPSSGSGEAYIPEDGSFIWFNNGYINNAIDGFKVIINSTNGSDIYYDTDEERTVYAPTGFVPSDILSNINFNVGNNLNIVINDITSIKYDYVLYLDLQKSDGTWQNIAELVTKEKNFEWNLSQYADTMYNLLSNVNKANIRINLRTRYKEIDIGMTQKLGIAYIVDANPNIPLVSLSSQEGTNEIITEMNVIAGFGPYNLNSNIYVLYNPSSLVAKKGATIEKIIIEANGINDVINVGGA